MYRKNVMFITKLKSSHFTTVNAPYALGNLIKVLSTLYASQ